MAALYAAREIVLPVVLASILKLLLQPAVRLLERLHVPRILSTLLLISLFFGTLVAFRTALSGPASSWAARLPEGVPRLQEHLSFLRTPSKQFRFLQRAEGYVSGDAPSTAGTPRAAAIGSSLWVTLSRARAFSWGLFETVLVLFFLLDDRAGTTHRPSRRRWRCCIKGDRTLAGLRSSSTCAPIRSHRGRRSSRAGLQMFRSRLCMVSAGIRWAQPARQPTSCSV